LDAIMFSYYYRVHVTNRGVDLGRL